MNLLRMGFIRNHMRSIWMGLLSVVFIFVVGFTVIPVPVAATDFVREISYDLEQPISGKTSVVSAGQYLTLVYQLALGLVGIIAVVIIMFGGLLWVQAAGNEQSISKAKELIVSAVVGLLIALLSYTILAFVNPETLRLNFSVQKIDITDTVGDITKLKPCDQPPYKDNTCINSDSADAVCQETLCGDKAFYNGEYCRGVICDSEDIVHPKCEIKISNPKTYQCQNYKCAQRANRCMRSEYKNYSGDTEQEQIDACLCDYYPREILPSFGVPYWKHGKSLWSGMGSTPEEVNRGKGAYQRICTGTPQSDNEWIIEVVTVAESYAIDTYGYIGGERGLEGGFYCPQYPKCGWESGMDPSRGSFYKCVPK